MASPASYSELQSAIIAWLDDPTFTRAGEMISLAEARLSRKLNTPEMEKTATIPLVNGAFALPADLMAIRAAYIDTAEGRYPLTELSEADYNLIFNPQRTGIPVNYYISGGTFTVGPLPDLAYSVKLSYKAFLPALSDTNPTNWLLTQAPDLYLSSAIARSELFGWNDGRAAAFGAQEDALLKEVNQQGAKKRYGDGPLVPGVLVRGYC